MLPPRATKEVTGTDKGGGCHLPNPACRSQAGRMHGHEKTHNPRTLTSMARMFKYYSNLHPVLVVALTSFCRPPGQLQWLASEAHRHEGKNTRMTSRLIGEVHLLDSNGACSSFGGTNLLVRTYGRCQVQSRAMHLTCMHACA
jgi:hypothetical protein